MLLRQGFFVVRLRFVKVCISGCDDSCGYVAGEEDSS
jgi:hypothetical protein